MDAAMTDREYTGAPVWVRRWRSVHLGWLAVVFGSCTVVVGLLVVAVPVIARTGAEGLLTLSWLAFFVLLPLGMAVPMSGIGAARLSRFVRRVDVAGVGAGLSVPGRGDFVARAGLLAFASVVGLSYFVFRDDGPDPRQEMAELLTAIGAPACLAWFVLGFVIVNRTRISLHPEGVVQQTYRRRGWKVTNDVTVVRWSDIADLRLEEHPNPAVPHRGDLPVIRVPRRSSETDEPELVIMACEKKVEPNSLLALLLWCRDNPWARAQLGHDDARELLRPPRLRERIRADRAASTSGERNAVR
ncbi:hypothetical protein CH251_25235 [Rhodococcus sp. 06-462-5]|nr:hypothetical protein CH251_25235 [Rhodococcus sp. 06-462-5]OZE65256.1 hypothetical protein CH270_14755 [Rhodococcus sp. 02-925g]